MKLRKKSSVSDESYWKSFTDIMAGLLLILMLIMMLLLLLLTRMNSEQHEYDFQFETTYDDRADAYEEFQHQYDHQYDNIADPEEGGGGGDGVDDPGTSDNDGRYDDIGHDKTAVFVTTVDGETGNVIKKEGTLFELYANRNASGGLQTLHTYYPEKTEYKQYETTDAGTFFLPEKITKGWYSLHNLSAPTGYGLADDVEFEIDESLDWSEPYMVEVPLEPAKSTIFVQNVDSDTNESLAAGSYEVTAAEDVVTLDGTVRYRKGEKVDEFTCDDKGKGASIKLYYGKYTVTQTAPPEFYALSRSPLSVTLDKPENESSTHTVKCDKTRVVVTLTDEFTEDPIKGAVYSISDKEDATTNENGRITIEDFDKSTAYTLTLKQVPEPYRISTEPFTFKVDGNGCIDGSAVMKLDQTAYIIRLSVDITDIIYKNSISGNRIKVLDESDVVVEEWEAGGSAHMIEGLSPGMYTLEIDGSKSTNTIIDLKDTGRLQTLSTSVWTIWDTISVALGVIVLTLIAVVIVQIVRRTRRKKKANG